MNSFTSKALLKKLRSKKEANGFTLIELMVVVAIVGVLSAVGLPELTKAQDRAKDQTAVATLTNAAKECSLSLISLGNATEYTGPNAATKPNDASGPFKDVLGVCAEDVAPTLRSATGSSASVTFIGAIPGTAEIQ